MDRHSFFRSTPGRLFAGTTTFALAAAGIFALTGASAQSVALPLIVLLCVVGSILTIGLSVDEHGGAAAILAIALPPVGGLYFAGLTVLDQVGPGAAVPLLALAAVSGWLVVRGTPSEETSPARTASTGAHAH